MTDPLDELRKEPKISAGKQRSHHHISKRTGGGLNFLSGIFLTGTIGVGLLFSIIFINPQSNLNPLPPAITSGIVLAYSPSSTPLPGLPPTWTPTIAPTAAPTFTPIPIDEPITIIENSPTPAANPESSVASDQQDALPTSDADTECNWSGAANDTSDADVHAVNNLSVPSGNQPHDASALSALNPSELVLSQDMGISEVFTPEIQYWEEDILSWAEEYELDPNLIATVMQIESCGYIRAKSAAGALGLFQVMPDHFKKKENPYDPDTNAYRGLSWLQRTLKSSDSISMALAGYNAGIARAKDPDLDWPDETQRYVSWGVEIYQDAQCGYDFSSALQNWLSKGGSALCTRASLEQGEE